VHVAAALDPIGGLLGVREFPATAAGYTRLLDWLGGFGTVCLAGIEGTGSCGAGLARRITTAAAPGRPRILHADYVQAQGGGAVQVTAPAEAAGLIDRLRASGAPSPTTRTPAPSAPATATALRSPRAGTADAAGTPPRERRQNSR